MQTQNWSHCDSLVNNRDSIATQKAPSILSVAASCAWQVSKYLELCSMIGGIASSAIGAPFCRAKEGGKNAVFGQVNRVCCPNQSPV